MAEFCSCGAQKMWIEPGPDNSFQGDYYQCAGCRRITLRCTCPVFCSICHKPLFNGETNPCCAPVASEVAHGE